MDGLDLFKEDDDDDNRSPDPTKSLQGIGGARVNYRQVKDGVQRYGTDQTEDNGYEFGEIAAVEGVTQGKTDEAGGNDMDQSSSDEAHIAGDYGLRYGSIRKRAHYEKGILHGGEAESHGSAVDHGIHGIFISRALQSYGCHHQELYDLLESGPEYIAGLYVSYGIGYGFLCKDGDEDGYHAAQETTEDDAPMAAVRIVLANEKKEPK